MFRFLSDAGRGRTERRADARVHSARIYMDVSLCEIYLNGGEKVFTSKLYPQKNTVSLSGSCKAVRHVMNGYTINY